MGRLLAILSAVAALGIGGPAMAGPDAGAPAGVRLAQARAGDATPARARARLRTVALKVENMGCASCTYILRRTLEGVDGVRAARVSYERKIAVVTYDPARCGVAQLVAATASVGFPSTAMR